MKKFIIIGLVGLVAVTGVIVLANAYDEATEESDIGGLFLGERLGELKATAAARESFAKDEDMIKE